MMVNGSMSSSLSTMAGVPQVNFASIAFTLSRK